MDAHKERVQALHEILDYLRDHFEDFDRLIEYYYSEQRQEDLRDDNKGLIDSRLKRGVLSEDELYDLISDYYGACIKMLELSTNYFKRR